MNDNERMVLLRNRCEKIGQSAVARELGYSPAAVNQALSGKYRSALTALLTRVEELYGATLVECPVVGEITLAKCSENRRRPFTAINPTLVRLYRECKECSVYIVK
jgi:DNA-binding transcriptional regulator YdaS (Cro superfamily)